MHKFLATITLACIACAAQPPSSATPPDAPALAPDAAIAPMPDAPAAQPDSATGTPTLLLLHGFGAAWDDNYMMGSAFKAAGWNVIEPWHNTYWCSSQAACAGSGTVAAGIVADEQYLLGLVGSATGPVYVVGHSNGAMEAWRLLCDYQGAPFRAGVVFEGIANSQHDTPCAATAPMRVLDVHGDADPIVSYDMLGVHVALGGSNTGSDAMPPDLSPGGFASLDQEGTQAGCTTGLVVDPSNAGSGIAAGSAGAHTVSVLSYTRTCAGAADHWRVQWGSHVPTLTAQWPTAIMAWLTAHGGA